MAYADMPVIIPLLAAGYLLTIYLLLILAQRTVKRGQDLNGQNCSLRYSRLPSLKGKLVEENLNLPGVTTSRIRPTSYKLSSRLQPNVYANLADGSLSEGLESKGYLNTEIREEVAR
jgi:hypothetical protein